MNMMNTLTIILQVVIALGIFNVWLLRFGRSSDWRGGQARTMKEEFAVYGLPEWVLFLVGFLKLLFAILLVVGIWIPEAVAPAAGGLAVLMLGAIVMHAKVGDPPKKSLPAFTMLVLSLLLMILAWGPH